jgi:hypothetical protein
MNQAVIGALLSMVLTLCSGRELGSEGAPVEAWLRGKRTADQCCTLDSLDEFSSTIQQSLDVLTQSVFEIGFDLQEFINLGMMEKYPASSCSHLCYAKPATPSGWYFIKGNKGTHKVYCNMEMHGSPFGSAQGWMKAIDFDMRRPDEHCPKGFKFIHQQGQRVCAKSVNRGCQSVSFPLHDMPYKRLCGRAGAFQVGTNNAFHRFNCDHCTINDPYVDGISLTYDYPRQHIWSLAASWTGYRDDYYRGVCPCARGRGTAPPKFVGDNYFCEVGEYWSSKHRFADDDPLWDGKGCGDDEKKCCEDPGLPWFCTDISGGTSKDIEVRVCADEENRDENLYFQSMEVYVQ